MLWRKILAGLLFTSLVTPIFSEKCCGFSSIPKTEVRVKSLHLLLKKQTNLYTDFVIKIITLIQKIKSTLQHILNSDPRSAVVEV